MKNRKLSQQKFRKTYLFQLQKHVACLATVLQISWTVSAVLTIRKHIKLEEFSQKIPFFGDDTILENSMDNTIETVTSDYSDLSVGNAFNESDGGIYNVSEDIVYNIPLCQR